MKQNKILLVGLPDTGKTTYLAALWYITNNQASESSLVLNTLANGEHEYLNAISTNWLSFEKVARTLPSENTKRGIMNLKKKDTGELVTLEIPDLSGETFESHFEHREWSVDFDSLTQQISGVMIFVNPKHAKNTPQLVYDENTIIKSLGETQSNEGISFEQWKSFHTPNQVKLVETLQFFEYNQPKILPLRTSIIISAWDIVDKAYGKALTTPKKWLEKYMPLLSQYLNSNQTIFPSQFFGVSAQGADYESTMDLDALINRGDAVKRVSVNEDGVTTNDISRPILWLIK